MNLTTSVVFTPEVLEMSNTEEVTTTQVLISDKTTRRITWVIYSLCEVIGVFGAVGNILNITCYVKLDLRDAINVSFLGLSISDFGSSVTLISTSLFLSPLFIEIDAPLEPVVFSSLITGWPHIMLTRITGWITALITLERCLCIIVPHKVRSMVTPRCVVIIIVCIVILSVVAISPIYYSSTLAWTFSPERNRTILMVTFSGDRVVLEQIAHGISNVFSPFAAYVAVIICTVILVVKLRQKSKWRMASTRKETADIFSERDQKVAKVVVMISAIFIACLIPLCGMFIAMIVEPRLAIGGEYENVLVILGGLVLLFEGTNSAMNIFIYYSMSTKYRIVFRGLFQRYSK